MGSDARTRLPSPDSDRPELRLQDARQQRRFVLGVAIASLMVNVDTYSVNVSLPEIASGLGVASARASWIVLAYNLAVTGGLLVAGRLGDRFGLRRVFLLGYALYALASLACGLAPGFELLVAARALQGLGGAVLFGLSPALVPRFLPANVRGKAFATLAMAAAFGVTIGAPLGGFISGVLSWRGIFAVNVLVGGAALLAGRRILPDDRAGGAAGAGTPLGLDLTGGLLSAGAALLVAYGLVRAPALGWTAPPVWGSLAAGVVALAAFVWREQRVREPLLDLGLFRNRAFACGLASSFLMYVFLAGTNLAMPFYLAHAQGLGSAETGGVMLVYALCFLAGGGVARWAADRCSARRLEAGALALGMAAAAGFAVSLARPGLAPAVLQLACFGVALAVFSPANNKTVMDLAPRGREGMVAGAYRMTMRLGLVFGVCGSSMALAWGGSAAAASPWAGYRAAYAAGATVLGLALLLSSLGYASVKTPTAPGGAGERGENA
jgi:EmrB/QacA subfamily drug resistance transporter